MKYLKTYENFNFSDINLYDYVILKFENYAGEEDLINFINNNIGQIISKNQISKKKYAESNTVRIKYENIPYEVLEFFENDLYGKKNIIEVTTNKIIAHSKSEEDLKILLMSNKYNL